MSTSFNSFLLFIAIASFQLSTFAQVQIGGDIDGEAVGDSSGTSVSMPDAYTIAIGAPKNSDNGVVSGHVRVYRWNGSAWIQKGLDIDGEAAGDFSGWSVSMPDRNTVAIGGIYNDGNGMNSGHVRVYRWNGNSWGQKGSDIDGENADDNLGYSVNMPDSNTIAIGARGVYAVDSGYVQIYHWNGVSWLKKGRKIIGEDSGDNFGFSVSMPDSITFAVSAINNDGNGSNSGHVKIYKWTGASWIQKGGDINGEAAGDHSGYSISMSDSSTVAIGAIRNSGNGSNSGHVRIYYWNGSSWSQKGSDLDGSGVNNYIGYSVNMPDDKTIAVGCPLKNPNGSNSGQVKIYQWKGSNWTNKSIFNGDSAMEFLGWSVSMPNSNILATGAPGHGIITTSMNYVRIYSLCNSTDTLFVSTCSNYTSPSGNYIWISSGTYQDTISNAAGCDSIITINLTVNQTARSTVSATACDSYLSPSGNYSWSTTGTYLDTISTTAGCDSIITINLTIDTINTLLTVSNDSLIAADTNASYQWLDCGNNYSAIPGATSRVFEPIVSGNYAVSLDKLSCKDTSACYSIVITGLQASKSQEETITIYPNPSNGLFTIDYLFTNESKVYTVSDINGKVVREDVINKEKTQLNLLEFVSGIYLLRIEDAVVKLILN